MEHALGRWFARAGAGAGLAGVGLAAGVVLVVGLALAACERAPGTGTNANLTAANTAADPVGARLADARARILGVWFADGNHRYDFRDDGSFEAEDSGMQLPTGRWRVADVQGDQLFVDLDNPGNEDEKPIQYRTVWSFAKGEDGMIDEETARVSFFIVGAKIGPSEVMTFTRTQ